MSKTTSKFMIAAAAAVMTVIAGVEAGYAQGGYQWVTSGATRSGVAAEAAGTIVSAHPNALYVAQSGKTEAGGRTSGRHEAIIAVHPNAYYKHRGAPAREVRWTELAAR